MVKNLSPEGAALSCPLRKLWNFTAGVLEYSNIPARCFRQSHLSMTSTQLPTRQATARLPFVERLELRPTEDQDFKLDSSINKANKVPKQNLPYSAVFI